MKNLAGIIVIMALIWLTGCASLDKPKPVPGAAAQQAQQQRLAQLDHWRLAARFSAASDDEAWHGTLYWEQNGPGYDIRFLGPFGQGGMQLVGDQGYASLRLSDGQVFSADDAESLLRARTDWRLPLNALRYWVLGRPAPDQLKRRIRRDSQGLLARLKYDGWTVEFRRYTEVEPGLYLPAKIFLENPRFQVRLVIDTWELDG